MGYQIMKIVKNSFGKLRKKLAEIGLGGFFAGFLVMLLLLSSALTYVVILDPAMLSIDRDPDLPNKMLTFNAAILLVLAVIMLRQVLRSWGAGDRGRTGSRLLLKMVMVFSLVAIVPAVVVGISSSFYLNLGIKSWFDDRVSEAVQESVEVANAYLEEHSRSIRVDAVNLSSEMRNNFAYLAFDNERLNKYLTSLALRRVLAEVVVFNTDKILGSSNFGVTIDPREQISAESLDIARAGEVATMKEGGDKLAAVIQLSSTPETFLFISRFVDAKVVGHTERARGAAEEYIKLKNQIIQLQINSTIFFVTITLFILLGAIWMAFRFALKFVSPISNLVTATDRIKKGEFTVRVSELPQNDEIAVLSRSFNQMASELESQRRGLIIANREAEEKSQFSEEVLYGVSSGVIALNQDRKVTLINMAGKRLLSLDNDVIYKYLKEIIPEFYEVYEEFAKRPTKPIQKQVAVRRKAKRMAFNVRINPHVEKHQEGYVITFDDVTELLSAQRSAAWSDVARKIAHEIRNPLTPINLSAQRLAKKYTKVVPEDEKESFEGYTNTIVRHTADIARIIGEFSNFSKLPAPRFAKVDISELLKDAVFSSKVASSKIEFALDMPDQMKTMADGGQISQVLTNIIKNAAESVESKRKKGGKISTEAELLEDEIIITIEDNGGGFPEELIDRITEPYVTTREKGTGLGLAIVKKILSDHNGSLELSNLTDKKKGIVGAKVKLTIPLA